MIRFGCALLLSLVATFAPLTLAADAVPTEKDPVKSARAVRLTDELRCLVCQNQTIADSNAELAVDLRRQVREQIDAGKSDKEIIDYMVNRYGDFVLYRPPVKATTLLLWGGPALLFAIGLAVIVVVLRGRRRVAEETPLTAEEHARAADMLAGDTKKDTP
ncbi:MAG: cytochrome c-type biogenesis protein [Betaproteobacteria bacterium]